MDLEEKKKRTETKALSKVRPNNEPDRLRLGMPVVGYSLSLPLSTACRAELATRASLFVFEIVNWNVIRSPD